ncbi:hypothetical protein ACCO45_013065 [Purpureocillium lilacinum]
MRRVSSKRPMRLGVRDAQHMVAERHASGPLNCQLGGSLMIGFRWQDHAATRASSSCVPLRRRRGGRTWFEKRMLLLLPVHPAAARSAAQHGLTRHGTPSAWPGMGAWRAYTVSVAYEHGAVAGFFWIPGSV